MDDGQGWHTHLPQLLPHTGRQPARARALGNRWELDVASGCSLVNPLERERIPCCHGMCQLIHNA